MPTDFQQKESKSKQEEKDSSEAIFEVGEDGGIVIRPTLDTPENAERKLQEALNYRDVLNKDGFTVVYTVHGMIKVGATDYFLPQRIESFGDFYIAERPCRLLAVSETHDVNSSGAANLQLKKFLSGDSTRTTDAPHILKTAFDLTTSANIRRVRKRADFNDDHTQWNFQPGDIIRVLILGGTITGNTSKVTVVCHLIYTDSHYNETI